MAYACTNLDCTVKTTGTCLLLHVPRESCLDFIPDAETPNEDAPSTDELETDGPIGRRFFPGFELGTGDAAELMRGQYGTMIAVLGQYDVGKTCFLISLYLLIACGAASPELAFSGSLTLNGFETRARRLRKWKSGALPQQLADHTVLANPRMPALLHIGLRETAAERRRFDLLITDLPGEWSSDLVKDVSTASRFEFVKRADGIVISLDGPKLNGAARYAAIDEAKHLITRLCDTVQVDVSTPLVLMVTKCDELSMKVPLSVETIAAHALSKGFNPVVVPVAAVSRTPDTVKSGSGVFEVVEYILNRKSMPDMLDVPAPAEGARNFAKIRGAS
jgi:hypothetical protein